MSVLVGNKHLIINTSRLKETLTKKDRENFLLKNPSIQKTSGSSSLASWLNKKANPDTVLSDLMKYSDSVGLTPQELYDLNKNYGDTYSEELLEAWQTEAEKVYGKGNSQIFNISISVRSFYRFFGKPLVRGRGTYTVTKKVKSTLALSDLIPFSNNQDTQFQAMVGVLSTIPSRLDAFLKLKWKDLKEVLEDKPLPFIEIPSEYQKTSIRNLGISQYSFCHSFAKKKVLAWREKYTEITKRQIDLNDPKTLEENVWITKQRPYKRPSCGAVESWFRERSKTYGKVIRPKDFRPWFNSMINADQDFKSIFMAQSGRYNGAYIQRDSQVFERLKQFFLDSERFINPEYEDRFKKQREKLNTILGSYGVPQDKIEEIARLTVQSLISMEKSFEEKKDQFIDSLIDDVMKKIHHDK